MCLVMLGQRSEYLGLKELLKTFCFMSRVQGPGHPVISWISPMTVPYFQGSTPQRIWSDGD